MSGRPRLGLLGGTFDPVHIGHLAAARAAQDRLDLDSVRFIPSAQPVHRTDRPRASGYHRMEMVKLAVAGVPGWEISNLELAREGPTYTFDTLTIIRREGLPASQVFFITGSDAFAEIETWHRYPDVLDLATFVVVARAGTAVDLLRTRLPSLSSRMTTDRAPRVGDSTPIIVLNVDTPDVSASDIRNQIARGESIDGLVPPAVVEYIDRHSLYRNGD
ncbi:MAG TPA: nicotinate-nucleotide adenylyltransferase [Vicinamibacterales bacterium]|nr:nicotinate-nucleotide adenylyltransferase [Vicinamibacterales bacterium]